MYLRELVAAKQAMRAQVLEEMLSSVQMTLDEQFFTSKTLHSSIMAQLQTFHSQVKLCYYACFKNLTNVSISCQLSLHFKL